MKGRAQNNKPTLGGALKRKGRLLKGGKGGLRRVFRRQRKAGKSHQVEGQRSCVVVKPEKESETQPGAPKRLLSPGLPKGVGTSLV